MTGWTSLTEAEVLRQFNASERAAYDSAKGDDSAQDLAGIITNVVDEIRLAYANGGRLLDSDASDTIPNGEKNRAIALVRWKFLLALPTGEALAKFRKDEADKATEYFRAVTERKIKFARVEQIRQGREISTTSFDGIAST